jgi:hypothetical protein
MITSSTGSFSYTFIGSPRIADFVDGDVRPINVNDQFIGAIELCLEPLLHGRQQPTEFRGSQAPPQTRTLLGHRATLREPHTPPRRSRARQPTIAGADESFD